MRRPATDVYEIVLEELTGPRSWWRMLVVLITNLISYGSGPANPGGMAISVRNRTTGDEVFRHVEDMGDDEGHLLDGIQADLKSMTVDEFENRWITERERTWR